MTGAVSENTLSDFDAITRTASAGIGDPLARPNSNTWEWLYKW